MAPAPVAEAAPVAAVVEEDAPAQEGDEWEVEEDLGGEADDIPAPAEADESDSFADSEDAAGEDAKYWEEEFGPTEL